MSSPASGTPLPPPVPAKPSDNTPERVLLVPYPKVVFLYPTFLLAIVASVWMYFVEKSVDPEGHAATVVESHAAAIIGTLFLGLFTVNLVILAFDFPRTTSLTLFFFAAAVAMGLILLFTFQPKLWPELTSFIYKFHPEANAHFYAGLAVILGAMFAAVAAVVQFDYWEVTATSCCTITASLPTWSGYPPRTCGWKRRSTTSSSFSCSVPAA